MELNQRDLRLIAAIQHGLPLSPRPYAEVGERIGLSEQEVIARIRALQARGVIKRFGVVVRHHECGYGANAMVVWDVPNGDVDEVGRRFARFPFVTLCYRRPRRPPEWPYNLYTMIHGRDRAHVLAQLAGLIEKTGAQAIAHRVLFSKRRFKQRGAQYVPPETARAPAPLKQAAG
ncbi:protein nirL [Sulfurifustis variabilis]|uniref:siroheme decarboxylase n=1 Tax=Sulfurifustis variabilis TaxID=1675686 RepID=A0A1B4V0F8_9GAMM|nr:AsnC family transcriptional regulator [Sulfurifustis variabilis]BAU46936.1 protein nirL [Sulfurifustis variabilis]